VRSHMLPSPKSGAGSGILEKALNWRVVNMTELDLAWIDTEPGKSVDSEPILGRGIQIAVVSQGVRVILLIILPRRDGLTV
jgi:hypothetical protein